MDLNINIISIFYSKNYFHAYTISFLQLLYLGWYLVLLSWDHHWIVYDSFCSSCCIALLKYQKILMKSWVLQDGKGKLIGIGRYWTVVPTSEEIEHSILWFDCDININSIFYSKNFFHAFTSSLLQLLHLGCYWLLLTWDYRIVYDSFRSSCCISILKYKNILIKVTGAQREEVKTDRNRKINTTQIVYKFVFSVANTILSIMSQIIRVIQYLLYQCCSSIV